MAGTKSFLAISARAVDKEPGRPESCLLKAQPKPKAGGRGEEWKAVASAEKKRDS